MTDAAESQAEAGTEQVKTSLGEALREALEQAEGEAPEGKAEESNQDDIEQEGDEGAAEQEPGGESEEEAGEDEQEEEPEEESEADRLFALVPKDWSESEQEAMVALIDSDDPDKQAAADVLIKRHNEMKKAFHDKSMKFANTNKELESINNVFKPYEQTMQQSGLTKAQYMQNMIQWEQALKTNPVATVKQIMQSFDVKPQALIKEFGGADIDLDEDFDYSDMSDSNSEVNSLKQELQELRSQIANQPLQEQIKSFETATDEEGNLLHPNFKQVAPVMGALIQSGQATTLKDAYSKAMKAAGQEDGATDTEAANLDRIRQKVAKSKRAQRSSKSSSGAPDFSNMSLGEELALRMKQAN